MIGPARVVVRPFIVAVFTVLGCARPLLAQPTEINGDAILEHPAGQLAVKAAGLLAAGKVEEVLTLGPRSGLDEWKKTSAEDRNGMAAMMQRRAPAPATFSDAVRKAGVLAIMDDSAVLRVDLEQGEAAIELLRTRRTRVAADEWTDGDRRRWRGGKRSRIEGPDLIEHPVAAR